MARITSIIQFTRLGRSRKSGKSGSPRKIWQNLKIWKNPEKHTYVALNT